MIVIFNLIGALGGAVALGLMMLMAQVVLPRFGVRDPLNFISSLEIAALFLGLYGLTIDRCERGGSLKSYWLAYVNGFEGLAASHGGRNALFLPNLRVATIVLPVAFAPIYLAVVIAGLSALDFGLQLLHTPATVSPETYVMLLQQSGASILLWAVYAAATTELRTARQPSHEPPQPGA